MFIGIALVLVLSAVAYEGEPAARRLMLAAALVGSLVVMCFTAAIWVGVTP